MIKNPEDNRKLQIFHLIVTCCFYVDFFVTGFIISNYEFLNIQTKSDKFLDLKAFLDDPNSLYSENIAPRALWVFFGAAAAAVGAHTHQLY